MMRVYLNNKYILDRAIELLEAGHTGGVSQDCHGRYLVVDRETYSWLLFGRNPPERIKALRARKKLLCSVPEFYCDNLYAPEQKVYTARLYRWDVSVSLDLYKDSQGRYLLSPVKHHKETYTLIGTAFTKRQGVLRKSQHYYCLMLHQPLIDRFLFELKHHGWLYDVFGDVWRQTGVDYALNYRVN